MATYSVIFAPEAEDDLIELYDYIAMQDGSNRALTIPSGSDCFASASHHSLVALRAGMISGPDCEPLASSAG